MLHLAYQQYIDILVLVACIGSHVIPFAGLAQSVVAACESVCTAHVLAMSASWRIFSLNEHCQTLHTIPTCMASHVHANLPVAGTFKRRVTIVPPPRCIRGSHPAWLLL